MDDGLRRGASIRELARIAVGLREHVIRMIGVGKAGHLGGSCSLAEIVTALYFHAMHFDPQNVTDPERDRLLLSKGHSVLIQYAALLELGVIPLSEREKVKTLGGILQGHPDMEKTPGWKRSPARWARDYPSAWAWRLRCGWMDALPACS